MKAILEHLFKKHTLERSEARAVLKDITAQKYNSHQVAAFLTVFRMRSMTVAELQGFRDALLDQCVAVDLREYAPVDLCGTGGDNKNTFNISTLAAFVAAGAGIKVAKHGNYGVSSVCGSSNVLEALGIKLTNDQQQLRRALDTAGICFLHAPLFHPAMKFVAPVRKDLAVKTFFNLLGPLVNPAFVPAQLVGVFNLELARLYSYIFQGGASSYAIVHTLDGYDEISLTGPVKIITAASERLAPPEELGFEQVSLDDIAGGSDVASAAAVFRTVLEGRGSSAQNAVVAANAGMAIRCARPAVALEDCFAMGREALASGAALRVYQKMAAL